MPAALRRTLLVLLTLTASLVLAALPASARVASSTDDEAGFVSRINADRRAAGLPAYAVSGDLVSVARRHAQRMADRGEHYHNANLANEVPAGSWQMLGENVGQGATVDSLHHAFMASPSHRANILRREFTQVGIGVARDASGRIFVVEVFRQPTSATAAPAPKPVPQPAPTPAPAPAPAPPPAPKPAPEAAPAPVPQPAPTTTVPPTRPTVSPIETVAALVAPAAPAAEPVLASVTTPATPSLAGPATVAAMLIAGVLAALAGVRRQLLVAP